MRKAWTVAVAVAGVLAMAAGAVAQEPGRTEEQVRERVEQQVGNVGEADQLRTQQETEQAIEQRAKQPEGAGDELALKVRDLDELHQPWADHARQRDALFALLAESVPEPARLRFLADLARLG